MTAMTMAMIAQLAVTPACTVPGMVPEFWPAVVKVEAGHDPLALHDDVTNHAYHPQTADAAEAIATRLMGMGHSVGVGLSQLTAISPAQFVERFGVTIREALDGCRNMHVGAHFYVLGALSVYNSGSPTRGIANGYVRRVMAAVGSVTGMPPPTLKVQACTEPDPTGWHVARPIPGCQMPNDPWHTIPKQEFPNE